MRFFCVRVVTFVCSSELCSFVRWKMCVAERFVGVCVTFVNVVLNGEIF